MSAPPAHPSPFAETPAGVCAALATDTTHGLTPDEAARRLAQHGPNRLPQARGPGALLRFLAQIKEPLMLVLLVAAGVAWVVEGPLDGGVILGVVLFNALVGFLQEGKAHAALRALSVALPSNATVVRGGVRQTVAAADIVPGDVLVLVQGDRVPADLRLLQVNHFCVDESALTGESEPSSKHTSPLPAATALADRENMAFAGAFVTRGDALGISTATGADTEMGRISQLLGETTAHATPLTRQVAALSNVLMVVILLLSAVTFALGFFRGKPAGEMFLTAVAMAVGSIPEGLPAAFTVALAVGVSRMARRGAIIRALPAVETLGCATVICTDKTGTLTQNRMTVRRAWAGGAWLDFPDDGAALASPVTETFRDLFSAGVWCNDSHLNHHDDPTQFVGDPTEAALLVAARRAGLDPATLRAAHPRQGVLPFDAAHAFMATLHQDTTLAGGQRMVLKGAVEALLPRCTRMMNAAHQQTALDTAAVEAAAHTMAADGLRVLAFCAAPGDSLQDENLRGLTLLGLQAMADPPRAEAAHAVALCHAAGIEVKMLTGDHLLTAQAIARKVGLTGPGGAAPTALTGAQLAALPPEQIPQAAQNTTVFARLSPEQKLMLVRALQQGDDVVAVTGDGVNDAPALRQADIGVAMGKGGTELAREAADMVLSDDNFATIAAAVEEGRAVYANLTRFLIWALPNNLGIGLVLLVAVVLGGPLPLLPLQALWLNLTTAGALGLALAFEPKEPGIMAHPPRAGDTPLFSGELLWRTVLVGLLLVLSAFGLFHHLLEQGRPPEAARTAAVTVMVAVQTAYLFLCRSHHRPFWKVNFFSNPFVPLGALCMAGLSALFIWWKPLAGLFGAAPLTPREVGLTAACGVAAFWLIALEKGLRHWWDRRGIPRS